MAIDAPHQNPPEPYAAAVILASGSGSRFGAVTNKVYASLVGRPVISWSLDAFRRVEDIGLILLVCRSDEETFAAQAVSSLVEKENGPAIEIVHGGPSRHDSELYALRHLASRINDNIIDSVLIHDGARPFVSVELIETVLASTRKYGSGVPAVDIENVVAVDDQSRALPLQRSTVGVQTPQGFQASALLDTYVRYVTTESTGTDTAGFIEQFSSLSVHLVLGDKKNFKITYPEDLVFAHTLLEASDQ